MFHLENPKVIILGPFMTSNFLGCLQDLFLSKFLLMMLLIMPMSFYEHENVSYVLNIVNLILPQFFVHSKSRMLF
jgi:hypothetical protein